MQFLRLRALGLLRTTLLLGATLRMTTYFYLAGVRDGVCRLDLAQQVWGEADGDY